MISRGHRVALACPRESRICSEAERFGVPATALPIGQKHPAGVLALRRAALGGDVWTPLGMVLLLGALSLVLSTLTFRAFEHLARDRATLSLT